MNTKQWGLIAVLLSVAVLFLVTTRLLEDPSDPRMVVSPSPGQYTQNPSISPMDRADIEGRLTAIETRLEMLLDRLESGSTPSPETVSQRPVEQQKLQQRLDDLTEQLAVVAQELPQNNTQEMAQLASAASDPLMRQKYFYFLGNQRLQELEYITETFQNELVDDLWADDALAQIESTFNESEALSSATLLATDCRTSICRLEVTARSSASTEGSGPDAEMMFVFENELLASMAQGFPLSTVRRQTDDQGGVYFEIYLFREGYEAPRLPNPLKGKDITEMIEIIDQQG